MALAAAEGRIGVVATVPAAAKEVGCGGFDVERGVEVAGGFGGKSFGCRGGCGCEGQGGARGPCLGVVGKGGERH